MHGRPRPPKGSKPDEVAERKAAQKAALYAALAGEVLSRRKERRYDAESLGLAAKLLELNPEVYTVWNYRKEGIAAVLDGEDREAAAAAAQEELVLTEKALMKNPKSYSSWQHRKWVMERRLVPAERDLVLVGKLLDADDRNFHGWGYRRWLARLMGITPEEELEFSHKKIEQNFSNYSAWHSRTALLPEVHSGPQTLAELCSEGAAKEVSHPTEPRGDEKEGQKGPHAAASSSKAPAPVKSAGKRVPMWVLRQELDLVQQAFFTEPEDQSGWFYHRWLLGACLTCAAADQEEGGGDGGYDELREVLSGQAQMCRELLEEEPDSKWPLLTLARILEMEAGMPGASQDALSEAHDIYRRLATIDRTREGYYKDALSGSARVTIQKA